MKVEYKHIKSMVESLTFKVYVIEGTTTTACWAFLPNGWQLAYGESSCVDPNNFDVAIGEKYAKERCLVDAENKLWELEGYLLKMTGATSAK